MGARACSSRGVVRTSVSAVPEHRVLANNKLLVTESENVVFKMKSRYGLVWDASEGTN